MLQGDEIRACWQAPSRVESYDGLFRELGETAAAPGEAVVVGSPVDELSTRTWVIPVATEGPSRGASGSSGLREATYVPARSIVRDPPVGPREAASADLDRPGVVEDPPVGEDDPDGDRSLVPGRVLGDLDA